MKLSYTNVKTFKDCPKKYEFKYIQHLPEPEGIELQVGIIGHEILAAYYAGPLHLRIQETIDTIVGAYYDTEYYTMLSEALKGYHEWAQEQDKDIKILSVEQEVNVKLGDYVFTGKIDAIGEAKGQSVLLEHKFKGQWGVDVAEQFQFDEQNKGYAMATGCRQIIYNLIRTKAAKTRPKFERIHIIVPESEVIRFQEDLGLWGNKIEEAKRSNEFPRNRGYGCMRCPFVNPCYELEFVKEMA